jgi:hypothetical protein
VLSGAGYVPRNLAVLAARLTASDGADFAAKFDPALAHEVIARSAFGRDPVEAQIYATALSRAVKRAMEK